MRHSSSHSSSRIRSTHEDGKKDNDNDEESLIYYKEHGNTQNDENEWSILSSFSTVKDDDNENDKNMNDHPRIQNVRRNKRKTPRHRTTLRSKEYSQVQKLKNSNIKEEEENIFASLQRELCPNAYDSDDSQSKNETNEKSNVTPPKTGANRKKPLILSPLPDDDSGPDNNHNSDDENDFWDSSHPNGSVNIHRPLYMSTQSHRKSPHEEEKQLPQNPKQQLEHVEPQSPLKDRENRRMEKRYNHLDQNFSKENQPKSTHSADHYHNGNNKRDKVTSDMRDKPCNTGNLLMGNYERENDDSTKRSIHLLNNKNENSSTQMIDKNHPLSDLKILMKKQKVSKMKRHSLSTQINTVSMSKKGVNLPISSHNNTNNIIMNKARTMAALKKQNAVSSFTHSAIKNKHNQRKSSSHSIAFYSQPNCGATTKIDNKYCTSNTIEKIGLDHPFQSLPSLTKQIHQGNDFKKLKSIRSTSSSIVGSRPAHWDQKRNRKKVTSASIATATSKAKLLSQATKSRNSIMKLKVKKKRSLISSKRSQPKHDSQNKWQQNVNDSDITFDPVFLNHSKTNYYIEILDDVDIVQEETEGLHEDNNDARMILNLPKKLKSSSNVNNDNSTMLSTPQLHINTRKLDSNDTSPRNNSLQNECHDNSPSIYSTMLSPTNIWPTDISGGNSRKKKTSYTPGPLVSKWKSMCRQMEGDEIRLQSKSYPFSMNRSNRNDPRYRMDAFIDVTIVGNSTKVSATLSCVLGYIHSYCKTKICQNDTITNVLSDIQNNQEKTDFSQPKSAMMDFTSNGKNNFNEQIPNTYAWLLFAIDTIRKQSIAPNAQLRVYDTIIISLSDLSGNGCIPPVHAKITGLNNQSHNPRTILLCTRFCEPYPKILAPLPKLSLKDEK